MSAPRVLSSFSGAVKKRKHIGRIKNQGVGEPWCHTANWRVRRAVADSELADGLTTFGVASASCALQTDAVESKGAMHVLFISMRAR